MEGYTTFHTAFTLSSTIDGFDFQRIHSLESGRKEAVVFEAAALKFRTVVMVS